MTDPYAIADTSRLFSPALVFFADLIKRNIARMVEMAGGAARLRPHVKTHKSPDVAKLAMAAGITKHKCATLAEAEMLARCGAEDVLLAYPMVGPNCARFAKLVQAYPATRFSCLFDHPAGVEALGAATKAAGVVAEAMIDLDVGQHRTGIAPGPEAVDLYAQAARTPGLRVVGLHVYDGHNHQESAEERQQAATAQLAPALALRERLRAEGLPAERVVVGGTPTFPMYARMDVPGLECSPGTLVLHDNGYGSKFADLTGFMPAALILTRVISRPTPTRVTFDLGYKAVASDPPAGKRLRLLGLPPHETVLQNEEHLVIETAEAGRLKPGDEALAIPQHICPTVAMHQRAYVIEGGRFAGTWDITGRDRVLGV
ncbi:MAG: D-TA family PLP-dependent enzyme [Gemmataceae bacterium]|nr:D-TA family PLP-dependent enzyme [Gemmataceae bacterium]